MVYKICFPNKVTIIKDFMEHFEDPRDDTIATHDALKAINPERMVNEQYSLLCDYVLSNAKIKENEQYNQSVQIINETRNYYNSLVALHKTGLNKDDESKYVYTTAL